MPPQQPDRLLDLFDESFDFSAHDFLTCGEPRMDERGCSGGDWKVQRV
jgi:hypothetical protein